MSAEAPQADEHSSKLEFIRTNIEEDHGWGIRDIDVMANGSAFVFYLRSKGSHRFLNHLGETVNLQFDVSVMVPELLVSEHGARASEDIIQEAIKQLKIAKSCARI